jgi:hypothetical protein
VVGAPGLTTLTLRRPCAGALQGKLTADRRGARRVRATAVPEASDVGCFTYKPAAPDQQDEAENQRRIEWCWSAATRPRLWLRRG